MHCTLTSRTALKPLELISKKMKKLIIFLLLANFIACKRNANFTDKKTEKEEFTITNSKKEISFDDLEEVSLPFCLKKVEEDVSYHYYNDIDFFLSYYKLKKSLDKEINTLFHKGTIDFLTEKDNSFFKLFPYYQDREDSPPFAVKKIKINEEVIGVFYVYIKISELIIPRIELQTFDKQGNYIDSLIVYYKFVSECSGDRHFCIDKNFLIKINTEFGCAPEVNEGETLLLEWNDVFKITEPGKIVKQ